MKLRCLIISLLGFCILGVMGILALETQKYKTNMLERYAETQLLNATDQTALKMTLNIAGNLEVIQSISEFIAQKDEKDWENVIQIEAVKNIVDRMQFKDLNICGINGTGFDLKGKEQKVDFCSYYQRALLGDTTIAFTNYYETNKETDVLYTVPITRNKKIIGVLRMAMETEDIGSIMSINMFRGKEDIYLLQRDGAVLTALRGEDTGTKNFFELLNEKDPNYDDIEQVIKQGRELIVEAEISDAQYYLSYKGIKDINDWGIVIAIPKKELISIVKEESTSENMSTEIVLLFTAAISVFLLVAISFTVSVSKDRIESLAYYDEITDSITYNLFHKNALGLLHKSSDNYAMIQIAIDRFDYIKEFFGAQEGNRILQYISKVLKENTKTDELFCRYNSDYFILFLKFHSKEELTDRINFIDVKINTFEEKVNKTDKYELILHYGIYCSQKDDTDIDFMISRANKALLLVKNDRKQTYEFFSGEMQSRSVDEKEIEEHMFTALEEKEFLVYLQPKYDLSTGLQVGAEALVRWLHPDKGLMYPGRFISVFEKNGFIVKLDMYMLDILCHKLKTWISKGYRPMPLSINISRLNLFDENFLTNVEDTLNRYGIQASLIQFEIEEEVISDNIERLSSLMERLKEYGFLISMDGFGTGSTSMNTIYHVPVDELKLERKFLLEAEKTDRGKNVIKSIIDMAKRLDIKVVSEGVENKIQAKMLRELGCDMVQGFIFSDPLPIKEYENYAYGPKAKDNKIWL